MTEQELAVEVIDYLTDQGWEIYQEVKLATGGRIADIIGTRKFKGTTEIIVVECKISYSFDVIDQAYHWQHNSNRTYIAVEDKRTKFGRSAIRHRYLKDRTIADMGIGLLLVRPKRQIQDYNKIPDDTKRIGFRTERNPAGDHAKLRVTEAIGAKFRQRHSFCKNEILNKLRPEHQQWAQAGTSNGRVYSPFQETCESVRKWLLDGHQGSPMSAIIENISHHYASAGSAKNSLRIWTQQGKIRGVRCEPGTGNKPHLYYGEEI